MLDPKLFLLLVLVATLLVVLMLRFMPERNTAALPRWLWAWVLVLGATTLALSLLSAAGVLSLSPVPRWVYTALALSFSTVEVGKLAHTAAMMVTPSAIRSRPCTS